MSLFESARFRLSASELKGLPDMQVPEIAFAGRSNAGKSTTINVLTRQGRLAFASKTPGRTQLINFFSLTQKNEEGGRDHIADLVDLPGYGFAKVGDKDRKRWGKLIDGYFESDRDLRLVVQLLDCRHEPSKDDYTMLDYLTVREIPFIIALTKADKLNKTESEKVIAKFEELCSNFNYYKIVLTSSDKGTGIEELKYIFEEVLADDYDDYEEETEE